MVRNTLKGMKRPTSVRAVEEELPESARNPEEAHPVDQGRVPPVRSRDEANIDADEALPDDEEEQAIAENPEREEVRFGEAKPPRSD